MASTTNDLGQLRLATCRLVESSPPTRAASLRALALSHEDSNRHSAEGHLHVWLASQNSEFEALNYVVKPKPHRVYGLGGLGFPFYDLQEPSLFGVGVGGVRLGGV